MKKLYRINVLTLLLLAALCSRCAKHEAEDGADPMTVNVNFSTQEPSREIDDIELLVFDHAGLYVRGVCRGGCGSLEELSALFDVKPGIYTIFAFLNKNADYRLFPETLEAGVTEYSGLEVTMLEEKPDGGTMLFGYAQNISLGSDAGELTVSLTPRGAGKICSFGVTVNPWVDRETEVEL